MPPNTRMPMARRLGALGSTAITSGSRPRMKAKLVIITGRKRSRAPSVTASTIDLPARRCCTANSVIADIVRLLALKSRRVTRRSA
jgi:hypothetical protein